MSGIFRRATETLIIIFVTAVLGEVTLRLFFDRFDPESKLIFQQTSQGYRLGIPGFNYSHVKNTGDFDVAVKINRDGFRDSKSLEDSTSDDWFVVGDSFSFGFGVEQDARFSDLLQAKLGQPVYNISIPNDVDGYFFLISQARKKGASVAKVIVGFCMENDLGYYPRQVKIESDPTFLKIRGGWSFNGIKYFLATNSAIYMAITEIVHHAPWLRHLALNAGLIIDNLDGTPPREFDQQYIDASANRLEELANVDGIEQLLIVLIPSRRLWLDQTYQEEHSIHQAFVKSLNQKNLWVIDLRPGFESTDNPLALHFKNDGHWNASGHALAAEIILESLSDL